MTNGQRTSRRAAQIAKALIVLACCAAHCILEVDAAPVASVTGAMGYLSQFGYLPPVDPNSRTIISEESFSKAISEFQSFVGIDVTGNLDAKTLHMMSMPRCGVKDKIGLRMGGKARSYAFFGSKWEVKSLTYKITKYPRRLDKTTVDGEIHRAFNVWSEYTDLTFTPKSGQVDIEISFVTGEHGDGQPLDGSGSEDQGNVLAHAFAPGSGIGGDAHFDNSELWTVNSYDGTNLFQVAAHEFGHSLGLDHSEIEAALMAPIYRSYNPNFMLHKDDITGIQALYGPKTNNEDPVIDESPVSDDSPAIDHHPGTFDHPSIFDLPGIFDYPGIFDLPSIFNHHIFTRPGFFRWSRHL